MKKNMGTIDRIIRILVAVAVIALFYANVISGVVAAVLLVLSGVFIVTSFIGSCPLYSIFGWHTNHKDESPKVAH